MRYGIIGNSAAGLFAAEAIRKQDAGGSIEIFSDEAYPAYARCLTSYYLTGQMAAEHMYLRAADFYNRTGIKLHCNCKVVKVDAAERQIYTAGGQQYGFQQLLIASGASPLVPDLPGITAQGVFCLRTLEDAKGILACSAPGRNAVVIGGGFVSLKAAYALRKAGLNVTCLISSAYVMSQMLDREAAALVAGVLGSHGLQFCYGTDAVGIITKPPGDGDRETVCGIALKNGAELPADVVIIGKGVKPNTSFLTGRAGD